ncbi:hypothetical protein D5086_028141 [Populus alba]|uniref:Uncharacterized protein n=1 Tax=Populus alba TaxID=43335 RepID=A0ACC4AYA6_POPAL
MAKSKALRKERQPGGDDFSLQSKRRLSQRAVRVSSRSCSPEQSPSPSHNKHHSKVTLADFVNLSSESRVLSSQRGIAMASLNPSASSPCSADFVCNSDQQRKRRGKAISQHAASPPAPSQYHPSLSCPTERVPYPPTTSTHCPGYGSASPTGVVTGISSTLVHFPDVSVAAACSIKDADVQDPVDKWKHCLVGYVAGKFPGTRKRPHAASTCATSSGSSADTAVVEKQSPYCPGPSCIYREDPMSSEVAVMDLQPSSSQPPNCKRTKAGKAEMVAFGQTPSSHLIPRRQYFTRSKAAASSYEGPTSDSFQSFMSAKDVPACSRWSRFTALCSFDWLSVLDSPGIGAASV